MILEAISILIIFSIVVLGLTNLNLKPGYYWFLALGASMLAWVLILVSGSSEPQSITLLNWESSELFFSSPKLVLDAFSWPFAVALTTTLLSVLLTDIARIMSKDPNAWAGNLVMVGFGLLGVLAANPLTLLIAWAMIDVTETMSLLRNVSVSRQREQVVIAFSIKVLGMLFVISAILRSQILGVDLTFSDIPSEVKGYLILAAGLRLGVLQPHKLDLEEPLIRRGSGAIRRLVPIASSLVLVTRVASTGLSQQWEIILMTTSAVALFYAGFAWIWSKDEIDGYPFWILGLSSLVVGASVQNLTLTSQVWGLSLVFSGTLLFLHSARYRRFLWLPFLGLVGISTIPYTPGWHGLSMFSGWNITYILFFLFGLALMTFGYIKHSLMLFNQEEEIERWVWILYPIGLAVLPLTHYYLIFSIGGLELSGNEINTIEWLGSIFIYGIVAASWFFYSRGFFEASIIPSNFRSTFSFSWLFRILWWGYRILTKLIAYFARLLEGEAGVLWAVLIMMLLVTIILQRSGGG